MDRPPTAVRIELGAGPEPAELLRRVADWPGLVCLHGHWADGSALLTSHPVDQTGTLPTIAAPSSDTTGEIVGGGWFGWIAYDGTVRLSYHDHVVRYQDGRWYFESLPTEPRTAALRERHAAWVEALRTPSDPPSWTVGPAQLPDEARHLAAVEGAVELIRAGELYQVNVCTRVHAGFAGSPAGLFADAVSALRPERAAFVEAGGQVVASLSPELFLQLRDGQVRTAPIKGTLPRAESDVGNAARLRASVKDTAENVMIVDLVRNDLGRVCDVGSVRVTDLLSVQPHPGVWHLVSTVAGRLRPDVGVDALLAATLPPGSVTGAPKLRALAAIAELEAEPRGIYTGAIGFVSPVWGAEFNVAIRTFEIADGRLALGVGGGVTVDSVPVLEWRECLHKAAPLLRCVGVEPDLSPEPDARPEALLETVLAVDGRALRVADHLARLDRSARELFGTGVPSDVADRVCAVADGTSGRCAVRVVLHPDGRCDVTAAPVGPPPRSSDLVSVARTARVWRHKWADRRELVECERRTAPASPLFLGPDSAVLETSRGNVFLIADDGGLVTAPLRDDVLPGITRRAVLDLARDEGRRVELRSVGLAELSASPALWTSSLSGAVAIDTVDGVALPRADKLVADLRSRLGIGAAEFR